ncbi:Hypothetical predicted protein [Mytilus galloprovincialis]|uniref:Tc1-like transposase DDE domain-containing protein n=1 Tax=Mytilus galloprovincialis TaxID=29158 RepID=A0A8B6GIQ0_MYTGA|nr:Hypothetical predicted protein [Mytilus galloprovincialis]
MCDRFGGGGVMVWAGITHCGRTDLKFINGSLTRLRYREEILSPIVQPFIAMHGNRHTFEQENDRCHAARVCTHYLRQNNIDILSWPALSTDLAPIKHFWNKLDKCERRCNQPTESVYQLRAALVEE